MSFMEPEYEEDVPYVVTRDGIIPTDYYDGPESDVEERGVAPVLWRLSASGYLDATDWTVSQSLDEARAECLSLYDVCPDCGEDAGEDGVCEGCGLNLDTLTAE